MLPVPKTRLPQPGMNFYFEAAKVMDKVDQKQGSIKGILATLPEKDRKRTAALVIETLKYKPILLDVIEQSKLLKEERKKLPSLSLALVLVHDLLLSGGIQAGDGPVKQAILRHKTRLRGEFQKLKIKKGAKSNKDLAQLGDERAGLHTIPLVLAGQTDLTYGEACIPRYVRVNTLLWSTQEAIEIMQSQGFTLSSPFESKKGFLVDEHVPDLLSFSPEIAFHENPFYKSGKLILQDKASCFPAIVLAPPATDNAHVIDATAAPGNKTSLLSALMKNKGKLFAFERDNNRFKTLTKMLAKAQCKNVEALNLDFLTVDPSDPKYQQVTHILLDPSCSGSGIVNRLDYLVEADPEEDSTESDRLNKLASFQTMMIKHAMKFPGVQKIVYSTCSIHPTENEHVVREILRSTEAADSRFSLAPPEEVLPQWSRRGMPEELTEPGHAASLVRCSPGEDATNGFFVSCFVRESRKRKVEDTTEAGEPEPPSSRKKSKKRKKRPKSGDLSM